MELGFGICLLFGACNLGFFDVNGGNEFCPVFLQLQQLMIMNAIIFDLDQTLVDSKHIEHLRRSHQWSIVYQKIPTILAYDGINEVLSITRDRGIKLAIVSSGPSSYVHRVVWHFGWSFDVMVCYHDTIQHKPHPAPFIEATNRLKIAARDCWAVGDEPKDIIAARAAGMHTVAALWGSLNKVSLKITKPDAIFETVTSFYDAIVITFHTSIIKM